MQIETDEDIPAKRGLRKPNRPSLRNAPHPNLRIEDFETLDGAQGSGRNVLVLGMCFDAEPPPFALWQAGWRVGTDRSNGVCLHALSGSEIIELDCMIRLERVEVI
jgi:hypothetical protein